jgi:hypothetical protein
MFDYQTLFGLGAGLSVLALGLSTGLPKPAK